MTIVEYLKSLVSSLKIREAIQKLSALFTLSDPDLETTTIILSSEYNLLRTQNLEGVIDSKEFNHRIASLNKKVLDLIKEVEENFEIYSQYFDKTNNNIIANESNGINKDVILFLCSNPEDADIDLTKEIEEISEKLSLINHREKFEFRVIKDLRKKDFQRAIIQLDSNPKYLHFAGSGNYKAKGQEDGLKLLGNDYKSVAILEPMTMTRILRKFDSLECLFLNACNTTPLSIELSKTIPYIIAMDNYVSDNLAVSFASSFYEALAAGRNVEFSFHYALDNIALEGKFSELELKTPRLIKKGQKVNYKWHGMSFEDWKKQKNEK